MKHQHPPFKKNKQTNKKNKQIMAYIFTQLSEHGKQR